ncbi:unnamed protein product [Thlaspi arvense]|uniref:Late embryogenesis abundant protein LEA-2 subgroup domain-containing protein n=1 Tax=Thlaspi arvense TaxID=13288 RepID=A0AAU9T695_THLAR|nr:unnamed protein product [Thlaspi arvense]
MAESKEDQAKPLSPLSLNIRSDQPIEDHYHHDRTKQHVHSRTKLILCCGLVASLTLLIAVTFIVLSLTVFHLHNPNLTVNSISFIQPSFNGEVNTTQNATVSVGISLRNPNPASFKVKEVTVLFHYGDLVEVGKSSRRSETIPAKRTVKMNLTAEIVTTKLLASVPGFTEDLNGRGVELKSSVGIIGKVKLSKIFKKSVHLITDCNMTMMMNNFSQPTFHCSRTRNAYEHVTT